MAECPSPEVCVSGDLCYENNCSKCEMLSMYNFYDFVLAVVYVQCALSDLCVSIQISKYLMSTLCTIQKGVRHGMDESKRTYI